MSHPVIIVDYDPQWPILYEEEKRLILKVIKNKVLAIEHIGSTAIPGLGGKPIIDIMVGVCRSSDADECVSLLHEDYKDVTPEPDNAEWYYCLGKRCRGNPSYYVHLHLVKYMSEHWHKQMIFRDFLRSHPDEAQKYFVLKKELAAKYGSDRVGYTEAKTSFIQSVIVRAHHITIDE